MVNAVIFDLDGTIIDTEKYFRICWPQAFEHFGYKMTDEQYLSIRSLGKPFVQKTLKDFSGDSNFDYDKVVAYRSELMEKMIEQNGLQIKKGAVELLEFLKKKNIVRAIATASPVDRSERYLRKIGLLEYFDRIISARNMKEGKPSPDVYSFACKELNFAPENCFAVEDSPNGVLSAYRAGCKVIMVPDQSEPDSETEKLLFAKADNLEKIIDLF
ncbi:MAG: HAD family phosphatase [Treponema sp.]|nr:HAD family phosphatase [Treponema sp.]